MLSNKIKKELSRILGPEGLSFSREDILCYSYDAMNNPAPPEAVAFPKGPEEVSLILKMANVEGFPVVPRGAGTGFTGGSVPVNGGIVISLERMNRIREIDTENFTADVEPGVITGDLQSAVEAKGLFYPPDPSSLKFSTIGGNIAECAGGPRAVKYGVTKDYVLGLEVVTPTGEIIDTGTKKNMKSVVGYDLTRLMVGSEGTLGIVTRAFLRLIALPEKSMTILVKYGSLEDAARTVIEILGAKILPSTLEIIDEQCLRAVDEYAKFGLAGVNAALLIEVDGRAEGVKNDSFEIERIAKKNRSTDFHSATDKFEVRDLWSLRRSISPSLKRLKSKKLNEDVVVPRSRLVELIEGLTTIKKKRDVLIASFGHAGDGNIHINIMVDKDDPGEIERGDEAVRDVFDLTITLGGTISGEHGIGTAKAPYIDMELSNQTIEFMKAIKKTLDPRGVLNPGKIFPSGQAV